MTPTARNAVILLPRGTIPHKPTVLRLELCHCIPQLCLVVFSSVQSLSHVWLFVTPWTAACQASLSITNSWSLLKLMSIESVMPSNHLILCCPLLLLPPIFPSAGSFSMSQFFTLGGQSIGVSASASVLQWIFRTDYSWLKHEYSPINKVTKTYK